ncbi:hypothetical protein AVEN_162986-1 [Araneus ventricosus]|uniref:Uncharacterized protein n=1 Tax=Araneus ventricosus TaxID=182803 RepID=A0A4Y2C059_ARAVE|nr:hypothetical protein AVEN_162986-1 [Araneus ventricosus]
MAGIVIGIRRKMKTVTKKNPTKKERRILRFQLGKLNAVPGCPIHTFDRATVECHGGNILIPQHQETKFLRITRRMEPTSPTERLSIFCSLVNQLTVWEDFVN